MRAVLIAFVLLASALPAAAQTAPAPAADADAARAAHLLAAIWRPLQPAPSADANAAFTNACAGAAEEMAQVDAAVPATLSAEGLSAVRAPHGLVIVPTADEPRAMFVFANAELTQITSGMAAIRVINAGQGLVSLTDAHGQETLLQLGQANGKAMMRILRPEAEPLIYVGCAATTG